MCTAFVSIAPDSAAPVLLLSVRDEYTDRRWLPPGLHWPEQPDVVGGLDLGGGGAWLAVATGAGAEPVAACLLNGFGRTASPRQRLSRGGLPLIAVGGRPVNSLRLECYDPFHLIVARPSGVRVTSWTGNSLEDHELPAGLSVVLNDGVDGRAGAQPCPHHIRATMAARATHFRARLRAVERPEPLGGRPDDAWGQWLPIACGDGLPVDDPAALIRRLESSSGRAWGAVSLSLLALAHQQVRYDFGAVSDSDSGLSPRVVLEPRPVRRWTAPCTAVNRHDDQHPPGQHLLQQDRCAGSSQGRLSAPPACTESDPVTGRSRISERRSRRNGPGL
ncbi:NRDE family protein [Streptomyces sp. NRRL WC-3742]|uniref:NRDE family protein n=1 Tax=Streptomyces sp. NRRL WC-3742 TaxID=1463934 RepID=UPI000690314C|nr:NRDE family protein [Streptomyces sp. NRRL WC-3742]